MGHPNLFDFATSELSQDAFLCWLAALADHDDTELQRLGRSFIAWLWTTATKVEVEPSHVRLQQKPRPQWKKIDVTLDVVVAGEKARLIIEDKTGTGPHDRQLERYLEVAEEKGVRTVPLYFKTGYHFGEDVRATAAKYTVVGLSEWVEFLKAQTIHNDIFDDYRAYVSDMLEKRQATLATLMSPTGHRAFEKDYVQFEFMKRLAVRCPEFIGRSVTYHDRSVSGQPWTQHAFAEFKGTLPGGTTEALFYRIDRRGGRWFLSVRQYAVVKGVPAAQVAKLARLREYRKLLADAVEGSATGLAFERAPVADHRGKNESEIGVLFFDDATNSTTNVLEMIPAVHRAFVANLARGSVSVGDGLPL
jgi:hypothetical protein